jgi:hypothetical protein
MIKRRIKILLKVLLTLFVFLFVFLLFERIRGQISLTRYKRELVAKGEKLTFRELIPPVPGGENGAPEISKAAQRLQKGAVLPDRYPPKMKIVPSGRAIVGFRENEWVYDGVTNTWKQLVADLKTNEATLAQIRIALGKPVLNNQLDYSQGFKIHLDHLSPAKRLTYWFGAASQLALHEGRPREALDSLVVQIRLPRLLAEDRIVISELVRIAIAAVAEPTTWEALQADGWTDEDLAKLQEAWESQEFINAMVRGLEGERAFGETAYEQLRYSNEDAFNMLYWREFLGWSDDSEDDKCWWKTIPYRDEVARFFKKQVYCRVWRFAWLHQDERHYLEGMQQLIEMARAAKTQQGFAKFENAATEFDARFYARGFYDRWRYANSSQLANLSRPCAKTLRAESQRSVVVSAIALKRYSLRYGKLPASLDSLVQEFLAAVPMDYMDGKPMKYRLNSDGSFTLYSVGENGKDDGGDTSLAPDKKSTRYLWNRRDYVWPSPALPDEIEVWQKEAAKN